MSLNPLRSVAITAALGLFLAASPPSAALISQAPATAAPVAAPSTAPTPPEPVQRPVLLPVTVINRYPHDPAAFTQGLIVDGGIVYESVGLTGQSEVRRVALETGQVLARSRIPASQFGEGLARWRDHLFSLTWHEGIAYRWRLPGLRADGRRRYTGEGWGLASDADGLILSDGSATLRFINPRDFAERRRITVMAAGQPLRQLNELEVVDGRILANVWMTPFILVIDPADGRVSHVLDLRPVLGELPPLDPEAVANGIAWDARHRRLFITGKRWPTLFEIAVPNW